MRNFLIKTFYHPVLFFFLLPVCYLALGSLFSLQYNQLNILSLVIFYLFIFINQLLENMFLRIPADDFQLSQKFVLTLELLNGLVILYFGLQHSWIASLVLIGFTLIIQLQFLFSYYNLDHISALITTFFKVILLNGFAFYIGTNFIHTRFAPYYFGLFVPFYLYEASRIDPRLKNRFIVPLIVIGYLAAGALLWPSLNVISLLLLLSLPFAWLLTTEYSRKTTAIYTITFSILYIGLHLYVFFQ